jgi:hypothetical protein
MIRNVTPNPAGFFICGMMERFGYDEPHYTITIVYFKRSLK